MGNHNLRNIDPDDPKSVAVFAAAAAAAFDQIKDTNIRIETRLDNIAEWRTQTETRLAVGAERFKEQNRRIREQKEQLHEVEESLKDLPDTIETAVAKGVENVSNGRKANGNVTFKWILEKVALPLLMSGTGAGVGIALAVKVISDMMVQAP